MIDLLCLIRYLSSSFGSFADTHYPGTNILLWGVKVYIGIANYSYEPPRL